MRRFLHEFWPIAAVTLLTVMLVLQIPRKALFPMEVDERPVEAFAAFVQYDEAAYAALVQNVRMSWQVCARAMPVGDEGRTSAFDFAEPPPAPRCLPRAASLPAEDAAPYVAPRQLRPLLPPSCALSGPEGLAVLTEKAGVQPRDPDLLALPDSLLNEQ